MMFSSSLSALVVLASLLGASARKPPTSADLAKAKNAIPLRYIIEFDTTDHLKSANLKKRDTTVHEAMYAEMRARGLSIKINQEYTADLFIGASISIASHSDLASIASIEGVLNILPVRAIQLPSVANPIVADGWTRKALSSKDIKPSSGNSTKKARQVSSSRRNTGFSNLPQIQADQVHAQGNKGKGVKIGIIDHGVDYTRTPLGGCYGRGCKVAGGYDFVGDNFVAGTDPVPDNDPIDKCNIHGTIVAGIIGADDNEYNVPGVAPEASLYQYRVFSCTGYTTEDVIFQAMQRAYIEDMDVINMSLEVKAGWTQTPLSVMASRLVQAGVVVTAAAGNVDPEDNGPFYAMGPAAGRGVISAGSVNNTILPAHNATTSTGYGPITYYNYKNFFDGTYPIYTYPNDPYGCTAPQNVDLGNVLVVVREGGGCTPSVKAQAAYFAGANRIIFAQETDSEPVYQNFPLIDNAVVNKADGDYLFANNGTVSLTFTFNPAPQYNKYSGGIGYEISAQGPTYELFMSTQVLTPGTNIIGLVPFNPQRNFQNWTITPGTSWSSAFAAGSAALYLNAKGVNRVKPRGVREALQTSANPVRFNLGTSQLHSVAFQGAGVIQTFDSINFPTIISPSEIYLNDTQYFQSEQVVTITNSGRDRKDYSLSNLAAGTALALDPSTNFTNYFPTPQIEAPASVQFSESTFSLRGGDSKRVTLRFKNPNGVDPKSLPIVSGFVQVQSGSEKSTIPYLGVAQRMGDVPVFDSNAAYFEDPAYKLPLAIEAATGSGFNNNPTFDFTGLSFPGLYYRFAGGSAHVYLDLVRSDANLGFTPNFRAKRDIDELSLSKRIVLESRKVQKNDGDYSTAINGLQRLLCRVTRNKFKFCVQPESSFAKVPIAGNLFERTFVVHDTNDFDTGYQLYTLNNPNFANGTRIPSGNYRFLFRGLHVFGNPDNQADYETYVSNTFTIAPAA